MSEQVDPRVRYVVFHSPGPQWQRGVDFRKQPGVMEHVLHYRQLFEQGKLEIGGPFLQIDAGGMMVTTPQVSFEEINTFADADPAVQAGILRFEIRAWYTPMARQNNSAEIS